MTAHDERIQAWKEAIQDRAELAEERFKSTSNPTEEDIIAIALAYPERYEIQVRLKQ